MEKNGERPSSLDIAVGLFEIDDDVRHLRKDIY